MVGMEILLCEVWVPSAQRRVLQDHVSFEFNGPRF